MKKLMIVLFAIGSFASYGQDSTKQELTKDVIYKDVKNVLAQLGETLKVGSEHVYGVLVKQQIVDSITWLSIDVFLILATWISFKVIHPKVKEWSAIDRYEPYGALYVIPGTLFFVTVLVFTCSLSDVITGFTNPEYGAIKTITKLL